MKNWEVELVCDNANLFFVGYILQHNNKYDYVYLNR